jgi:hypothetical protein
VSFLQNQMVKRGKTVTNRNEIASLVESYAQNAPTGINGAVVDIVDTAKLARYRIAETFDLEPKEVDIQLCFDVALAAFDKVWREGDIDDK